MGPALWIIATLFCVVSFLQSGWSQQTQITVPVLLIVAVTGSWSLYVQSNRVVHINKTYSEVRVEEMTFFGKILTHVYPLNQFAAICSYISPGRGAMNVVELAEKGGVNGLALCSFPPSAPGKFWSLSAESENPKANALAAEVAEFLALPNMGFIGHRFPS
jgi:hypothetical protein